MPQPQQITIIGHGIAAMMTAVHLQQEAQKSGQPIAILMIGEAPGQVVGLSPSLTSTEFSAVITPK